MAKFTALVNRPGYLPDSDPVECETFAEARDHIAEQMQEVQDNDLLTALATDEETPQDSRALLWDRHISHVKAQRGPFEIIGPDGMAYCVYAGGGA